METYSQFEQQALAEGKIDFDGVFQYQCVDLILQYAALCYGVRGERGNAIDYWTNPSPVLLTKFTKLASQDVQQGDIVILNGLTGNPYGHIMIGTGNATATTFEGLEQNGGNGDGDGVTSEGNEIRTRQMTKSRIAGILRPTVNIVAAAPVSSAPAAPSTETYTIVKDVPGFRTSTDAANHASQANTVGAGDYHIFNQYNGMVNVTSRAGVAGSWINPADNAAPTPAAPAPAPAAAPDGYQVVKDIPGYVDSNHAANHLASQGTVHAGTYSVFNQAHGMVNVTLKPGEPGDWINPSDNVAEPAPTPPPAPAPVPEAPAVVAAPLVEYTKLATPMNLVINKNTQKWDLGFASGAEPTSVEALAVGLSFTAYGKAQRTDGDKPAYFMTQEDFGNADQNDTPTNNVGVNTIDLSPAPALQPPLSVTSNTSTSSTSSTTLSSTAAGGEAVHVSIGNWKNTYQAFLTPQKYIANANVICLEIDEEAPVSEGHPESQQLVKGQTVTVAGTFSRNGVKYYRTVHSANNGYWYGIPVISLTKLSDTPEDELDKLLAEIDDEVKTASKTAAAGNVEGFLKRVFHRK